MNENNRNQTVEERLEAAYNQMLERIKTTTLPNLQDRIEAAKEKAVELGELSGEEAEKIGDYLHRDLKDAAEYMAKTGKELREWLSLDVELIEDRLLKMFSVMVDHTMMELDRLALEAWKSEHMLTGEITAMGTLRCADCGKEMRFRATGHIPPCPKCHGTAFARVAEE